MGKLEEVLHVVYYVGISTIAAGVLAYGIIWVLGPLVAAFAGLQTA